MKKLFLLIIILTLNLFGQGWNDIVTTTIIEPVKTDIFTNSSGIHLLIQTTLNNIVYYNLNSAGEVNADKTVTFESSGFFPNIIGSNDKIYAIYKTGNNIRVRYSTNNGSSWLTDIADRPTTANYCNGVDAVYDLGNGVHIVWATRDDTTPAFETYYYRLNTFDQWVDPKTVTDYSTDETGGNPSVTVSPNRVHVSFNTDPTTSFSEKGDVKTRDKYNGNWQDPQTVVSTSGSSEQSIDERLLVRGEYLYLFYSRDYTLGPHDLRFRTRRVDNTTGWSDFTTLESVTLYQYEDAFEITKTTNDYIHILYKKYLGSPIGWAYTYKYYDGTNWITEDDFDHNSVPLRQIGLSSVSNDLFCTWVKQETDPKMMRFRQYDAIPLAPQNLTATAYQQSEISHPKLNWSFNNEPDVYITSNAYEISRRTMPSGGSWSSWSVIDYVNGDENEYVDYELNNVGADAYVAEYKIRAKDYNNHYSSYSSVASITFGRFAKQNEITTITEYKLEQNFPNPFNPTTTINYSIQKAGEVTLKVYDMLGKEAASLVNELKEAGYYSVNFNASILPSGIYFYTLTSGNFMATKKLILLK
jgi:hypothetical protein